MRAGGGKAKGASFERAVCKTLSLWVTHGDREDLYWRSAMSGGRSTVAFGAGKKLGAQAGDISSVDPEGAWLVQEFFIECKHVKDLYFQGILRSTGALHDFWRVARQESRRYKKLPMLIARQNAMPAIIVFSITGIRRFGLNRRGALFTVPGQNLYAYNFERFLKKVKP